MEEASTEDCGGVGSDNGNSIFHLYGISALGAPTLEDFLGNGDIHGHALHGDLSECDGLKDFHVDDKSVGGGDCDRFGISHYIYNDPGDVVEDSDSDRHIGGAGDDWNHHIHADNTDALRSNKGDR